MSKYFEKVGFPIPLKISRANDVFENMIAHVGSKIKIHRQSGTTSVSRRIDDITPEIVSDFVHRSSKVRFTPRGGILQGTLTHPNTGQVAILKRKRGEEAFHFSTILPSEKYLTDKAGLMNFDTGK